MRQECLWERLTAPELNQLAKAGAVVLVPVGSTEQHGPHLPTGVDSMLASAVCRRAAEGLTAQGRPCIVAPTVWTGIADHHVDFGGTFSVRLSTFIALLTDVCASIATAGFTRIALVNGHGGNMSALAAIGPELARTVAAPVHTTTYFIEAAEAFATILEDQATVMHACEAETSMIWALDPAKVRQDQLAAAEGPAFDMLGSLRPDLKTFTPFSKLTTSGVMGVNRRASAAKGERLLTAAAEVLARRLDADMFAMVRD